MAHERRPWQTSPEWDDVDEDTLIEEGTTGGNDDDDQEPLLGSATDSKDIPYTEPNILVDRIYDYDRTRAQRRGAVDYYDVAQAFPSMLGLNIVLATTKTLGPLSLGYEKVRKEERVVKKQRASEDVNSIAELVVANARNPRRTLRQSQKGMGIVIGIRAKKIWRSLVSFPLLTPTQIQIIYAVVTTSNTSDSTAEAREHYREVSGLQTIISSMSPEETLFYNRLHFSCLTSITVCQPPDITKDEYFSTPEISHPPTIEIKMQIFKTITNALKSDVVINTMIGLMYASAFILSAAMLHTASLIIVSAFATIGSAFTIIDTLTKSLFWVMLGIGFLYLTFIIYQAAPTIYAEARIVAKHYWKDRKAAGQSDKLTPLSDKQRKHLADVSKGMAGTISINEAVIETSSEDGLANSSTLAGSSGSDSAGRF